MRFQEIKLYVMQETGKDALGNPINEPVLFGIYQGRLTQWTVEEIALLDREVTRTQRKLMTDAPAAVLKQIEMIGVGSERYGNVDVKSDFIRWRLCHVKEHFT